MHSDVSTNDDAEGVSVSTDNNKYKCECNRPNDILVFLYAKLYSIILGV